jgi:hypothetical protein
MQGTEPWGGGTFFLSLASPPHRTALPNLVAKGGCLGEMRKRRVVPVSHPSVVPTKGTKTVDCNHAICTSVVTLRSGKAQGTRTLCHNGRQIVAPSFETKERLRRLSDIETLVKARDQCELAKHMYLNLENRKHDQSSN